MNNKQVGDIGEKEVCQLILCPNCNSKLILLPPSFPMFDVQCTKCMFRAQDKTINSKPSKNIRGAGWTIYEKVVKAGYLTPPLFVNFKWFDKEGFRQVIWFFPFIAKGNLKPYKLSPKAKRANYEMFRYINLDKIPFIELYSQLDPLRLP